MENILSYLLLVLLGVTIVAEVIRLPLSRLPFQMGCVLKTALGFFKYYYILLLLVNIIIYCYEISFDQSVY